MVSRRRRDAVAAALPCGLLGSQGYQLDTRVPDGLGGPAPLRERALQAVPRHRSAGHRRTAMTTDALPSLLRAFFHSWMGHQRNLSPQTVTSYRDAWRLFLQFVSRHVDRPVA